MNDMFEPAYPPIDQVVDLLEAYADARLSPRGAVLARMRKHVIAELDARTALLEAERGARLAAARPPRWRTIHVPMPRGLAAAGMAAALTFGTSAAVLAAPPGSPFYNARVAIEQALLPQRAAERIASIEQHLEERLAEAQAAAARGDAVALQAALDAYQAEVDAAVAELGWDVEQLAHLESELGRHTAVLEALAAQLPEQAAIEHAIETSQKAAQKLHDKGKPADAGQPAPHATPAGGGGDRPEVPNQR